MSAPAKKYIEIPRSRPVTPLLDTIEIPSQLRELDQQQLLKIVDELREYLLYTVGQTGGHFGAGLGVVELTVALHYIFNTPEDRIVWDVGHQTYPHKILCGRREQMHSMRQEHGLAGFPKRSESVYDAFGVGHSSTSISAALGMAIAVQQQGLSRKSVAVIGDGAMTAGIAFEALNHAAHVNANILVILNDNQMSISHNTGGLSTYFSKIWASKTYNSVREGSKKVLSKIPPAWDFARRIEEHMKGFVTPGTLFEELGFNYIGPIDGHDLPNLISTIGNMAELPGPQLLHIITQKGKGFEPAEEDPVGYHAINKIEAKPKVNSTPSLSAKTQPKYQQIFGEWLCDMASQDELLVCITPAMGEGSGIVEFSKKFPNRYHDVAIAEQHAVTFAAGMATEGLSPFCAIYSTFLQRGYDQVVHDVAIQNLPVRFAIDRAGFVGADGPTHAGAYDTAYLGAIPNMVLMAPGDEAELKHMVRTAAEYDEHPVAFRFPRGEGVGVDMPNRGEFLEIGKGRVVREGNSVALLSFGGRLSEAIAAAEILSTYGISATVADARFTKPLDVNLIERLAREHEVLITIEEGSIGGFGSFVLNHLASNGLLDGGLKCRPMFMPDTYFDHAAQDKMYAHAGLDRNAIAATAMRAIGNEKAANQVMSGLIDG